MKKIFLLVTLFFCVSNLEAQIPDYRQFEMLKDKLKLMKCKSKGDTISDYRLLFVECIDEEDRGTISFGYSALHEIATNDFEELPGYFFPVHYLKTKYYGDKYKVTREVEGDPYRDANFNSHIDTSEEKVVIYRYFEKSKHEINEDSLQTVCSKQEKLYNEFDQRFYLLWKERDTISSMLSDSMNMNFPEKKNALKDSLSAIGEKLGALEMQQSQFGTGYYKIKKQMDSINYGELNVLCEKIRKYPCEKVSKAKFDSTGKYQLLFEEKTIPDCNSLLMGEFWTSNLNCINILNSSIVRGNSKVISGKDAKKKALTDTLANSQIAIYDYGNKYMVISVYLMHVERLQDDALTMTSYIGLATYYYKKVK